MGCEMARWFEDEIADKIRTAENHVILIPAQNPDAGIDMVDVYDGVTGKFIAADVPESPAREFVIIWNELVDAGDNTESVKKLNLEWLIQSRKRYGC